MSVRRRPALCDRRWWGLTLLVAGTLALAAGVAFGAAGDLDGSFGAGGVRAIDGIGSAEALALQPDGRIVVAGWNGDVAVARLDPDGADDPSFGGTRHLEFGSFDFAQAVALQPDGRIVVAGRTNGNLTIARLEPDGSPDMGFGDAGRRTIDHGGHDGAEALAIQPDGKIVVAGFGGADRAILVTRLRANGADDLGFGSFGTARVDFGPGGEEARALALQPDGKILVAGFTPFGTSTTQVAIARLTPGDGSPDMGFGTAGRRAISLVGASAEALVVQQDGKVVVAGRAGGRFFVRRLNGDGSDDPGFAGGGAVLVPFGAVASDRADAVALQPDGKIVAVGSAGSDLAVARLQPGGALDTTFGGFDPDGNRTGTRTIRFRNLGSAGNAVALQADGGIVVAGAASAVGPAPVARLQGDPAAPGGAGPGGVSGPGGLLRGRPPRCAGRAATIVGTSGRDVLNGTRRADVIAGLAGGDVVRAGAGDDLVCGGAGRDRLLGEKGADRLMGGAGPDRLVGGPGPDRLLGEAGRDRLLGGPGADALGGGAARDACLGGPGADRAACERRRT